MEGRRALITGSGINIGQMIAIGYAQAGADHVLVGRNAEPLEVTAIAAKRSGTEGDDIPGIFYV